MGYLCVYVCVCVCVRIYTRTHRHTYVEGMLGPHVFKRPKGFLLPYPYLSFDLVG
jgi:hypothetical protein